MNKIDEGISDWFMRGNARKLLVLLKKEGFKITSDAIMNEFRAKKGKLIVDIFGGKLDMVFINFPDETGVGPSGTRMIGDFSKKTPEEIQELFDIIQNYGAGAYGYSPNSRQFKIKQQARQALNRSSEFDVDDEEELKENTMKKSELKALIKEVIEEVESIRGLNLPVDVMNIPPEIMDMTVNAVKNFAAKYNLTFNLIDLKQFEKALAVSAASATIPHEKAPYQIFKELDPQKQVKFLTYVKWYERNK